MLNFPPKVNIAPKVNVVPKQKKKWKINIRQN